MTLRQTTSLLALAAGMLLAVNGAAVGQGKKSGTVVKATATATKPGDDGKQTVTITLEVDDKYHVYANPVGIDELKDAETTVSVKGKKELKSVKVVYPVGEKKKDKDVGDYKVYKGKVTIKAEVQRSKGDTEPLEVSIKLQACTNTLCLLPDTIKVKVD
jgi:thiol:disulfide interchange protein